MMSVALDPPAVLATCQYCLESVDETPRIIWAGEQILTLHPDCARSLAVALLGDVREAQLASGVSPWAARAARACGAALRAQESRR